MYKYNNLNKIKILVNKNKNKPLYKVKADQYRVQKYVSW